MPNCEEAVYSNDYFDFLIEKQDIPEYIQGADICIQELDENFAAVYYEAAPDDVLSLRNYSYTGIPKCFGLLNYDALESSGVMKVRDQPNLMLTGRGVLIGFIDTEGCAIILSSNENKEL